MSNLGLYQTMTILSKKVKGPQNLLLLTLLTGGLIEKCSETVIKKFIKTKKISKDESIYTVSLNIKYKHGLNFKSGDKFKVLESDGESILIEKIGDKHNPYFVSSDFLCSISDYNN